MEKIEKILLSVKKILPVIAWVVITNAIMSYFLPADDGMVYAIAPLVMAGIGAGIGALGNLLGGGDSTLSEDDIKRIMDSMPKYDDTQARVNLSRRIAGLLKQRQVKTAQKQAQLGINDAQSVYAYDEPIYNAYAQGDANIDALKAEDETKRKSVEADIRMKNIIAEKQQPNILGKITRGALTGASIGSDIARTLNMAMPETTTDTTLNNSTDLPEVKTPSVPKVNTDIKDNGINNYDILPEDSEQKKRMKTLAAKYGLNFTDLYNSYFDNSYSGG